MFRVRLSAVLVAVAAQTAVAQTATGAPKTVNFPGGDRGNGTQAATLLELPISPRAVGLGEAFGAVSGDPADIWYNAAGLSQIRVNSFIVTARQGLADTRLGGAAVSFPTDIATFGIAGRFLDEGTIRQTENYNEVGGSCRAYQMALEGGGALELHRHLSIGGSLFYSQETLCGQSAGTIGVNAGVLMPDLWSRLSLGGGVRNWGTTVLFDSLASRPPLEGYVSGAFDLLKRRNMLQTPMLFKGQPIVADAKIVGQVNFPQKSEIFPAVGVEGTVNGVAIGRIGYQWGDDNRKGISLGAGINVGQFRLEYAFRNRTNAGASFWSFDPIGDEHHVSATFFWGGPPTNQPVVPVIVTQPSSPIDTAAINQTIRDAVARELAGIRPLLDSLRNARVEVRNESAESLVARYVVPVHFAFDSAVVRDTDVTVLGQVADVIRRVYPNAVVTIEGFADPAGSADYNLRLSRRRADAVKRVMVERFNLPAAQFKTVGYGEQFSRQVAPGARKADPGAEENRRVTFTIDATQHYR